MRLRLERLSSPISSLLLVTDDQGNVRALDFADHESRMARLLRDHYGNYNLTEGAAPRAITRALDSYFGGDLDAIAEVPTATCGTPFQREVWNALRKIPPGVTMTYGQLAARIGAAALAALVGAANGANPIAVVVPCHRVIGANGKLTGYAGGLKYKRRLLDHETRYARIPVGV